MQLRSNEDDIKRWTLRIVFAAAVLVFLAALLVLVLRHQWDQQAKDTRAWYEQHVGSLDLASYLRDEISDQANLALAFRELSEAPFLNSDEAQEAREAGARYFGLYRLSNQGGESLPPSGEELAVLRRTIDEQTVLVEQIDGLVALSETRLERPDPTQALDWNLRALWAGRFRLAEVALLISEGRCDEAGTKALAVERMAAAYNGEAHLLFKMLGLALEKTFYGAVQTLAEVELSGGCTTGVDWRSLQQAVDQQAAITVPFVTVIAAEGAQLLQAVEEGLATTDMSLLERALGRNLNGWESISLASYGQWALDLSHTGGQSPPLTPLPARWLENDVIAQIVLPNLMDVATKASETVTSRRLTEYAISLAACAQTEDCSTTEVPIPVSYPEAAMPNVTHERGIAVLSFLPDDADHWARSRTRGTHTLRVPARLVAQP